MEEIELWGKIGTAISILSHQDFPHVVFRVL